MTQQQGWAILERDLTLYRNQIAEKIAYLDPRKPEFNESRILFIAVDKLFAIVSDYQHNRDKAIELMTKLENPDLAIIMDTDNETDKKEGGSADGL